MKTKLIEVLSMFKPETTLKEFIELIENDDIDIEKMLTDEQNTVLGEM